MIFIKANPTAMKRIITLFALLYVTTLLNISAQNTYVWGGFINQNYSNLNNWQVSAATPTVLPSSIDDLLFDATAQNDCVVDVTTVDVKNVTITSAFGNIVDSQSSDVLIRGNFSQAGGTFKAPDVNSSGGLDFKKPNISVTGGLFDNNLGITTLEVDPANGTAVIAGAITFNELSISALSGAGQRNVDFGTTTTDILDLNYSTFPCAFQGSVTITNALNLSGGSTSALTSNSGTFTFSGAGPISINGISTSTKCRLPNIVINTSGTYAISNNFNVDGNWTAIQGTLTAGTSTVNMSGTAASVTGTAAAFDNLNIVSGAVVNLPANAEVKIGKSKIGSGTLNFQTTTALGLNGTGAQTIPLSGVSLAAINAYGSASSRAVTLSGSINVLDSITAGTNVTLNTGGSLTLKATSSLQGRVGRLGGTISGNVTVETFIPGGTTGWANLGVDGVTGQTVANWDTYVSSNGANGIPMTCGGCAYSQAALGSWFNSIAAWDEPSQYYDTTVVATSSLATGKGYWVYVGDGFSSTNDLKLVNTGPLVQGSFSYPLTSSTGTNGFQGMNLVANPYACPISWTKVLAASGGTASGLSNAIYVWNADIGGGTTTSYVNGVSSHSTGITDIIPAGQGFYVQTSAGTNLVYNESVKTNANTGSNPLLRTASSSNPIGDVFHLKIQGSADWDETAFRVHPSATQFFDEEWDAHKIFQSPGYAGYPGPYTKYTTISSKDGSGTDYSINSIPALLQQTVIPVLAKVSVSGSYTITASGLENMSSCVLLKDNLLNVTQDLKSGDYVFTISDTTSAPRFDLVLCKDANVNTVGIQELKNPNDILISQDEQGAFVKTVFNQNSKAIISVYNIIGQKLVDDIKVEGTVTTTRLNLDLHNQVVLIRVASQENCIAKKMVLH